MALVLADRVKETTTSTGTGTVTLAGASSGFQSFSVVGNGNTTYYAIVGQGVNEWEVGIGTYTASGTTLSRDTVLASSAGGTTKVTFSAGTKDVFVTYPSSKSLYYQDTGGVVINESNSSAALRITNTGTGNALVVEDAANPDSTPFVIDKDGYIISGATTTANIGSSAVNPPRISIYGTSGGNGSDIALINTSSSGTVAGDIRHAKAPSGGIVANNNQLGNSRYFGYDGAAYIEAATISAAVDGTPGTNDMPGRLVFSTTADGASAPTERMRVSSFGTVSIGNSNNIGQSLRISRDTTGQTTSNAITVSSTILSDVTTSANGVNTFFNTQAASFTLPTMNHFSASQGTIGAGSAVTTQVGFNVASSLTGAANNYGFYSNIAVGAGRWNFYANGTASNFFGGDTTISVNSTSDALRITQTGTGNALVVEDAANPDSTPVVVDASGRVIAGGTASRSYYLPGFPTNYQPGVQSIGNSYASPAWMSLAQWSTSTTISGGAFLSLNKSNGVEGTHTIVNSGQRVGGIGFAGSDGAKFLGLADIVAEVDGTPGLNDMPGRLVFNTTPDGDDTPIERLRINANGPISMTGLTLNKNTIATNVTVGSGYNATSAGPVTINSGITVTVDTDSRWVIV